MIKVWVFKRAGRTNYEAQWVDPVTGLRVTRSTGTGVRSKADKFAAVLESDLNSGRYRTHKRLTWEQFRTRYENEEFPSRAKKTRDKISAMFNAVERLVNPKMLAALDASAISTFTSKLRKEVRKKGRRLTSEFTIASHLSYLRSVLRWAKDMKLIEEVPAIRLPVLGDGMKGRPVTSEEFERMLAKIADVVGENRADSWDHLLRGLWWSGLRLDEALHLHWTSDRKLAVDLSHRRPMFRVQAKGEKAKKFRILPMAPEFAEMLAAVPDEDRHGFVFNPIPRRLMGQARPGLDAVSGTISDIGQKAGVKVLERETGAVKYASAHDLRRSFGRRWAKRVKPDVLKQLMRHRSISTTLEFYVGEDAEDAADALWQAVSNISSNTAQSDRERAESGESQSLEK